MNDAQCPESSVPESLMPEALRRPLSSLPAASKQRSGHGGWLPLTEVSLSEVPQ